MRVVTGQIPPFVFKQGDALTGFSIDLWNALAQRLKADFSLTELGLHSESKQLQAVQRGDAELAISAITMTVEREQQVDFTLPYFDSGLQIIVRSQDSDPFLTMIEALLSPAIGQILVAALLIVVLLAHVLWLVERRGNPFFQKGYLAGIVEGLWGVMLIIATGEHGDREAPSGVKRLTVALMWLLGVVLIAQFTATVTSSLTVQQLQSSIQGPDDLPGKTIGTVPGSIAADYLTQHGLSYTAINNADEGYNLLMRGQVQAIVYEAPTLQYWAARRGNGALQVVGPIFRPEKYGIAVASGSPLRKSVNQALLTMYADGSYEEIYRKWFSQGK
ncbi:MAG: transporter substrate-binding domain-containing protein [Candidatus Competibacter sp.]|nr:transporter substrate-binding domain-containing protein [Candidatus Competibacter sp.]